MDEYFKILEWRDILKFQLKEYRQKFHSSFLLSVKNFSVYKLKNIKRVDKKD